MNRPALPSLCASIIAVSLSSSALIVSLNSARQAQEVAKQCQAKLNAVEDRTPAERAYAGSRIADELADCFITPDEAARRFYRLMSDSPPELLAIMCREEGTDDVREACRRRVMMIAKGRAERRRAKSNVPED